MFVVDKDTNDFALDKILERLRGETFGAEKTEATFFITGEWANAHRQKVFEIARDFEVGNYTYYGNNMAKRSEKEQFNEIADCHSIVKMLTGETKLISDGVCNNPDTCELNEGGECDGSCIDGIETIAGKEMNLFLPPNGSFDKKTITAAEKLGYKTVMWSRDATRDSIFGNATFNISGGDFIMMKPDIATFMVFSAILQQYARDNFTPVSVGENI
jgi:peptidoglycan/xylan/chitin deacetylase (PgdA/CDA1 family)